MQPETEILESTETSSEPDSSQEEPSKTPPLVISGTLTIYPES